MNSKKITELVKSGEKAHEKGQKLKKQPARSISCTKDTGLISGASQSHDGEFDSPCVHPPTASRELWDKWVEHSAAGMEVEVNSAQLAGVLPATVALCLRAELILANCCPIHMRLATERATNAIARWTRLRATPEAGDRGDPLSACAHSIHRVRCGRPECVSEL